ncbi:nucleoside diphosphate pyrophosphatase [Streptomyces sp. PBH53]|uniref:NUDIX domain-containing protein n=1 Tax=Streptomyces TaxID=1883 RepID=UPI0006558BED|nr:NUDIX domain-containing protein [Streptomyces sp. PBH53]AKN68988.1 nucleoside diphosphate pyrophosphatase [Streptomyces sp. PBH53]
MTGPIRPDALARDDTRDPDVRLRTTETVLDDWFHVRRFHLESPGPDGRARRFTRLSMARGDRAAVLPYCPARGTVVLTSQFRVPAFLHGRPDGGLLEVPGGLLDADDAGTAVRREAEEETGFRIGELREVCVTYLAPQLSSERTHLFVAPYDPGHRVCAGGGVAEEGEDIQVRELPLDEALDEVLSRPAADAKTLLLLLYLRPLMSCA